MKRTLNFLVMLFLMSSINAQSVQTLRLKRDSLIAINQSTIDLDRELYALNERFKAVVQVKSEGGFTSITFPNFRETDQTRKEKIEQRLNNYYQGVWKVEIDLNNGLVRANCLSNFHESMISEIVSHFAYLGYEIH